MSPGRRRVTGRWRGTAECALQGPQDRRSGPAARRIRCAMIGTCGGLPRRLRAAWRVTAYRRRPTPLDASAWRSRSCGRRPWPGTALVRCPAAAGSRCRHRPERPRCRWIRSGPRARRVGRPAPRSGSWRPVRRPPAAGIQQHHEFVAAKARQHVRAQRAAHALGAIFSTRSPVPWP